jgi:hypothetical protein
MTEMTMHHRATQSAGSGSRAPVTPYADEALSTGSPALAPLMLGLGRLVVTRLVLTRGRRVTTRS